MFLPVRRCWWILLSVASLFGQERTSTMRLTVVDPSGAPMQVSGRMRGPALLERTFETNAAGAFAMSSLPAGGYTVELSRAGFNTERLSVSLQPGAALERRITMTLATATSSADVVAVTPLGGVNLTPDEIPAPVQSVIGSDLQRSGTADLSDYLRRRLNGVFWNEIQGNPFQADLSYRGYTASPLLGTPQGLSIYMDGVRLNQPFGDIVSWDLIPRIAVAEMTLMPGSNPLFGLNTLGGSLAIQTKDGHSGAGTSLQLSGGSFGRKVAEFEHGGATAKGLNWYTAANLFFEDGWRESSPSNVRQLFARAGLQRARTTASLSVSYANNLLNGNGLQERKFLERDYRSVYTKPDINKNRSPFVNLSWRHLASQSVSLSGNFYYRYVRSTAFNGDLNEDSLDQSVYQPSAAEIRALTAAGFTGFPTSGATAANTPFPFWRCIANVLLRDEPAEKCNALLNRGRTRQHNYGTSAQATWYRTSGANRNQLTAGAAYDRNRADFEQLTQLGYLNPDRSVTGVNAFADGVTGGEVDGEPYDTRVNLQGHTSTGSVYATNTLTLRSDWAVTLSGRYNRTTIDNRDYLRPQAGPGSLTGRHQFGRFNPAAGVTWRVRGGLNLYGGYSEGSRAPTSVELGCADPATPCKLPNAMAGDPPLLQVVSRTLEAGARGESGERRQFRWNAGWFRGQNRNDILFVASEQTGFGYFKNFGQTLRQGLETGASITLRDRVTLGGGYTLLSATYRSEETVNGEANSSNHDQLIELEPGDRIPLIPRHMCKAYADIRPTSKLTLDLSVMALSALLARGNENGLHRPDGRLFLDPGDSPGYAVVNGGVRYRLHRRLELFVQAANLANRRYYSAAQLGATGFTPQGNYIARPFPAVNGEFPIQHATFYAPGAPRSAWAGLRMRF